MQRTNILTYFDEGAAQHPRKVAFSNGTDSLTFSALRKSVEGIGTALHQKGFYKEPVVVFMEKHPNAVAAFFGVVAAGCYYVPIDDEMPAHRIELIFKTLQPKAVICDGKTESTARTFGENADIFLFDELKDTKADKKALEAIRAKALDTDPIYIVFTSGSTGVPKGVCACHRSVIDYIENLSETLGFDETTVFGNQTPLYFDACLKELYPTIKFGATTYLIPKELFMQPVKLVEFLNEHKINTVCWVVSALTVISSLGAFKEVLPKYLHTIAFGSEVFPIKQLKMWQKACPKAAFTNLYGPTECTGMSCYYHVEREFELGESVPIGKPFRNTEIMLLDDENNLVPDGEVGEICIRGTCVTLGYYNDERTKEAFVQNPLNKLYPELIYKTGDLARLNKDGDLEFFGRKDYQIKHMGHRIELGEIELIANMCDGINDACAIFDETKKKIVLFYVGSAEKADVIGFMKSKLPRYMIPNAVVPMEEFPHTPNGKMDRKTIKANYLAGK